MLHLGVGRASTPGLLRRVVCAVTVGGCCQLRRRARWRESDCDNDGRGGGCRRPRSRAQDCCHSVTSISFLRDLRDNGQRRLHRQSVGAYVERWRPALCGDHLPAGHDLRGALCRRAAASGHEEREPDLCDTSGLCRQRTYSGRSAAGCLTSSRHAVGSLPRACLAAKGQRLGSAATGG